MHATKKISGFRGRKASEDQRMAEIWDQMILSIPFATE